MYNHKKIERFKYYYRFVVNTSVVNTSVVKMAFSLKPILGKKLIGRENEVNEIINSIVNNNTGSAIYGVRRVGKTSILLEVKNQLEKNPRFKVVYTSLWELLPSTLEKFILEFFIQMLDSYLSDIKIKFKELIKLDLPSIKKSLEHIKISSELKDKLVYLLDLWKNKDIDTFEIAKDILKLPQKLAEEYKCVSVMLLDEFPTILGYKDGESIVGYMRTLNERQDRVVYIIAGSERKTMEHVALSSVSPFYKQLISREIKALNKENVAIFIRKNLSWLKITDDAIDTIYRYSKGLPYYINLIGIMIENSRFELKEGDILDAKKVEGFILRFLNREGSLYYSEEFESLNDPEKYILGTMALYGASSPTDIVRITRKNNSYIASYLYRLKKKKIVFQDIQGNYKIRDPMFEQWIKYEFKGLE